MTKSWLKPFSRKDPLTAYELLDLYRETNSKAQSMTVYRALEFLQKHHFIHRLASKNAYAACDTPQELHHAHFLLCENCSQTQEISSLTFEKAIKKLVIEHQFVLTDKPIEISGMCKKCST